MPTGSATYASMATIRLPSTRWCAKPGNLRRTQGASLIEAITYRMGFHTSSDNPDLYRTEEEVAIWEPWDPLTRMRKYLERKELWDDAREEALWTRCKSDIADAVNQAETLDFPHPASMFDDTFQELTWMLEEQRAHLACRSGGSVMSAASVSGDRRDHGPGGAQGRHGPRHGSRPGCHPAG